MDFATRWSEVNDNTKVAFICAANEKRPGGDWETGVVGYEERLCRRSNLSAHLAVQKETNYPIPTEGGLYSDPVGEFKLRTASTCPSTHTVDLNAAGLMPFSHSRLPWTARPV